VLVTFNEPTITCIFNKASNLCSTILSIDYYRQEAEK